MIHEGYSKMLEPLGWERGERGLLQIANLCKWQSRKWSAHSCSTAHFIITSHSLRLGKKQRHFRRKSWVLRSIGWLFEIVGTGSVGRMATLLHRKIIYDRIHPQPQDDGYYIAETHVHWFHSKYRQEMEDKHICFSITVIYIYIY